MKESPSLYRCGITNVPAHFVTPICYAMRRWIEDKSEWTDKENVSKVVDSLIFFEKIEEED